MVKAKFSEARHVGDVRKLTQLAIPEKVDLVVGGFPCQDLSCMGKKEGCVICPYYSLCFLTDVCFVEVSHFSLLVFDLGICILAARILISYLEGKNIFGMSVLYDWSDLVSRVLLQTFATVITVNYGPVVDGAHLNLLVVQLLSMV